MTRSPVEVAGQGDDRGLARSAGPAKAVVFDGVVSQRLLDVAQEKRHRDRRRRTGSVRSERSPSGIRVLTRQDLQPGRRGPRRASEGLRAAPLEPEGLISVDRP